MDEYQTVEPSSETQGESTPLVHADERFALNPMERRFLFVDVAAQRAKQLRKGALNRIALASAAGDVPVREVGHKPERVAMEEVRRGFIQYQLPEGSLLTTKTEG